MINFITNNKSLALLLLSTIVTGIIAEPGFSSLIIHIINFAIILCVRSYIQIYVDTKIPAVGIFVSVGLTAVATYPTQYRIFAEFANFFILIAMWKMVTTEIKQK
jgi:hypothetical protein